MAVGRISGAEQVVGGEAQCALRLGVALDREVRVARILPATPVRAHDALDPFARQRPFDALLRRFVPVAVGCGVTRRTDGVYAIEPVRPPGLHVRRHALTAGVRRDARERLWLLEEGRVHELDGDASRGPQRHRRGQGALHDMGPP